MGYRAERYKDCGPFNGQYAGIHEFLLEAEQQGYNEHFPWGRFEWMHGHSLLEKDKLTSIVTFRDDANKIVGLITFDTDYSDRTYLIHTSSDRALLERMVETVLEREGRRAVLKVNSGDTALCRLLEEKSFARTHRDSCVLALDLAEPLEYGIPEGYAMSPRGFCADPWQYQLVIHKGFDNEGIPEKWEDGVLDRMPNSNVDLKIFALANQEYCAHCGVWYTTGDTAYVEPVVTVPEHRKRGLAKAVVYEACTRARALGAKRATVLSEQEFYCRIGFALSSEVYCWERRE